MGARSSILGVVVAVALTSGLVACSDDDDGSLSQQMSATTGGAAPAADGRWASLLQVVPDTADVRSQVVLADIAGAVEAADISRPPATASSDDVAAYLSELFSVSTDRGGYLLAPSWLSSAGQQDEEYRAELGYSMTQIDQTIEAGLPPEIYDAFLGSFDPDAIADVLAEVPHWSDVQETVSYGGVEYYRWGEDSETDISQVSPARPLGFGGRMAVDDTTVLATRSDAAMEAMIDARAGTGSLASNETFALLADAIEDEPVYSAFMTDEVPDLEAGAEDPPGLHGVEAYATAWGLDASGNVTSLLVLVSADEASADANIDLLTDRLATGESDATGEPLANLATVTLAETDGRVTTFRLETDRPRFLVDAFQRRDPIVANAP